MVLYKREVVGFVWQRVLRNLIPYLTALENVQVPMIVAGKSAAEQKAWATELLDAVGLGHRKTHRLSQLSGGEQQRRRSPSASPTGPPAPGGRADGRWTPPPPASSTASSGAQPGVRHHHRDRLPRSRHRLPCGSGGRSARRSHLHRDGARTAEETETDQTHEEFVVMDAAGRIRSARLRGEAGHGAPGAGGDGGRADRGAPGGGAPGAAENGTLERVAPAARRGRLR